MKILEISAQNLNLIPKMMHVQLIGNIHLSYLNSTFQYAIVKNKNIQDFAFPTSKPDSITEFDKNRYGYVVTENGQYIGHAVVEHKFNNTLYVEDFDISPEYRGKKYAECLMNFLETHAKRHNLAALSLEVQSNNVMAFLFYIKMGFIIGGFDSLFYEKTRQKGETAIYLYKLFQ